MGCLPVATFLAALVLLDSYKLVKLRAVIAAVVAGMAMCGVAYFANGFLLGQGMDFDEYTRYGAPVVEEFLKALVIVALIRAHRVGFLVDAAIFGFAVGTGFALVENFVYLKLVPNAPMGIWLVRGFGTAVMHGGATAIFGVAAIALLGTGTESASGRWRFVQRFGACPRFLPGFAIAVVLHSTFNHFFLSPLLSTAGMAILVPVLLALVFQQSEEAVGNWLGKGFDADTEMLSLINSGRLTQSHVGQYLATLKDKFHGPVVADLLCYLRLHTELALRAKGILMMREGGFEVPVDEPTREKFAELRYLEKSIGKTGRLALAPMLHMSHKDLWQLYMLGK